MTLNPNYPKPFPQFIELLRSGLWNRAPLADGLEQLSMADWNKILLLSQQQGVIALVGQAVQQLPQTVLPPSDMLLQWIGYTHSVEATHLHFNEIIREVLQWFSDAGIRCGVFKGETLSALYPQPNLRTCGDVDLWFPEADGVEKATEFLEKQGLKVTPDPHHAIMDYQDVSFELHPDCINLPFRIKIPVSLVKENSPGYSGYQLNNAANTVMLLTHAAHHFIETGLGLRHLCDWAVWLHAKGSCKEVTDGLQEIKRIGAGVFLTEFTALAVELLDLDSAVAKDIAQKSKDTLRLKMLRDMLQQGNLGKCHLQEKQHTALPLFYLKSLWRELKLSTYWRSYVIASIPHQFMRSMRQIKKAKQA